MTTPREDNRGLGRASMLLASGTVVSRVLGFISAIILARTLGTVGAGADTFALANQLPNNIYAIVAGGVLSAVLVPHIVKAGLDKDGGQSFINKIVTLGFLIFLAVAVLATLLAPALVALYAQSGGDGGRGFSPEEIALAVAFAYWCLPQILFYALYSLLSEVLNARKVFGPFTWAPALNNVVAMTGLVAFGLLFPGADTANAMVWTPSMVAVLAGSATAGVAAQAFILFLFWRRAGLSFRADFRWRGVGLGNTGRAVSWMFGMILVAQIAGVVQANVASLAAGGDAPSLAILRFSWLIFMLPHSVVAVSLATAYFTRMSTHARDGNRAAVRGDFLESVSRIGFFMVLASVGLIVVSLPFARQFGGEPESIRAMAIVIASYALGLLAFSVLFVVQRVFYALEDTRTPFFLQVLQATLFIFLALGVSTLPVTQIAVGLALSASIAGTVQTLVAIVVLRRKLGGLSLRPLVFSLSQFLLAALPSSGAGVALLTAFGGADGAGYLTESALWSALVMAVITLTMVVVYGGTLLLLGNSDARAVAGPLLRRLPFTRSGNSSS
ncbi:MAG: murein biosynthesis integral membrane protein MurJ [Pontimonas sp.]|nr:murein biosynthesis integral membrane protein MurJ [Pontimonas sp.]MDP4816124.1 murein biosynthesis integral membrane protein MurJ [Pontimonas sp.]